MPLEGGYGLPFTIVGRALLVNGRPRGSVEQEYALLDEITASMRDASICGLGQTAADAIESALRKLDLFETGGLR